MTRVLVVDDDVNVAASVATLLRARGYETSVANDGTTAIAHHERSPVDAVVLDVQMPGLTGHQTFERLKATEPRPAVVFLTAHASIPDAVAAMRAGADNYIEKPFDNDALALAVERALERRQLQVRVGWLEGQLAATAAFPSLIGRSAALQKAIGRLAKVAPTAASVLIVGETGTGKEHAARGLHELSRRPGRLVAVNCGGLPATLFEAAFFGHVRGAFTDAKGDHAGYFAQAHLGTLFLDEIGELPLDLQAKLLRALESGEVTPLGGTTPITCDVRVVAATNCDLVAESQVARRRGSEDREHTMNMSKNG
jgi:DNA-binding NtrC family response regulator